MEYSLKVTSSPHAHSGKEINGIMQDVVLALLPAAVAGAYYFGVRAVWVMVVSVLSCVAFEAAWQYFMKKEVTIRDLSAVITGMLLAFNLPPTFPLWMTVIGAGVAILIAKQMFGGLGHNFINPALAGRAFLMASWAGPMSRWTQPFTQNIDAASSATPLMLIKQGNLGDLPSYWEAFIGSIGGCIGETSALLLLLGGLYLIVKRVISPVIPLTFILTVFTLTSLLGGGAAIGLYHILTGGLFLGAFFMATDYTTSPVTPVGQLIMGVGCGILTAVIRLYGGYPEGVSYAILIMNVAAPLIDRYTMPRIYGKRKQASA